MACLSPGRPNAFHGSVRYTQADEKHEKAPNLLDKDLNAERPNQKWVVDNTYMTTRRMC
jgi:transposase InsO family protein